MLLRYKLIIKRKRVKGRMKTCIELAAFPKLETIIQFFINKKKNLKDHHQHCYKSRRTILSSQTLGSNLENILG